MGYAALMAFARGYDPLYTGPSQDALLDEIALRAETAARAGPAVGVFDLDGCLFDTRYRQVQIFRELASRQGLWELYRVQPHHFTSWDLTQTMRAAGIPPARVREMMPAVSTAFYEHFFCGDFVVYDHAMPGASALVWRCYRAGLQIVYLTGRHEEMRAGTEQALGRNGFPYGRPRCALMVRPDQATPELPFKEEALREIGLLGELAIFLDNEPINCNLFHQRHPDALVVFVETDHSPRPEQPHPDLPWLRGFLKTDALMGGEPSGLVS